MALGGDGGDELFAGYPTLQAHRLAGFYEALPSVLRDSVVPALVRRLPVSSNNISLDFKARRFVSGAGLPLGERHARWLGSFSPAQRAELLTSGVQEAIRKTAAPDPVAEHLAAHTLADPINQVLYLDMKLYLENDILAKVDRASMMASLEARVPLLNVNLVEYVTALPVDLKLRRLRSTGAVFGMLAAASAHEAAATAGWIDFAVGATAADGQGRTRREQTLKAIGTFSAHGEPFETISINRLRLRTQSSSTPMLPGSRSSQISWSSS